MKVYTLEIVEYNCTSGVIAVFSSKSEALATGERVKQQIKEAGKEKDYGTYVSTHYLDVVDTDLEDWIS